MTGIMIASLGGVQAAKDLNHCYMMQSADTTNQMHMGDTEKTNHVDLSLLCH